LSRILHDRFFPQWWIAIVALLFFSALAPGHAAAGRKLIVGSEQDYPPFAVGSSDKTASGFTVELWKAVAANSGLDYEIHVKSFREILDEFRRGQIDVMINLAQSEERRKFCDFSVPHVVVQGAIFVRNNEHSIHSEADLTNKSIIVIDGDLAHDYALSNGRNWQLVLVKTAAEGLSMLASGREDAMLVSTIAGMQTLRRLNITNVKPLRAKAGFAQKFSFAVRKGNSELLEKVNEGLSMAKSDRTYDRLYEKWFGVFEVREMTFRDALKYFGPVLAGALLVIALILARQYEREKVAARLRESEERYRRIVETAEEGVVSLDNEERITFVNPKMARMLGYSSEELLGRKMVDFSDHPERRGQAETATADRARQFDFKFRRKDGSALWTFISTNRIHDGEQKTIGTLAMVTDISERKKAEMALLREKELSEAATRISTLIHANLDPSMILHCVVQQGAAALGSQTAAIAEKENEGWTIRYAHGLPPETIGARLDPERDLAITAAIERVEMLSGASTAAGNSTTQPEAHRVDSILAAPIAIRGKSVGVIFFEYNPGAHVVTPAEKNFALQLGLSAGIALENARLFVEQNHTQQELRKAKADLTRTNSDLEKVVAERTAKLQETVAELEHFSYSITHDMRAPLRAMQGFATILNEETADRLNEEHRDYLNRIGTVAGRMDQLITDALNFSKSVRQELAAERVDVVKLLRGILDSYPELHTSRAQIVVEGEIPAVRANVAGLTQCFSNLLGNAVKFVKPGEKPQIRIWAEQIVAPGPNPGKNLVTGRRDESVWIRIWVEDKGIGTSKEFQPRVFDMFQRESNDQEGTGIGLALVRKVTERMGGSVGVESVPGEGSRFWLMLKPAATFSI
jgi:polar amino acid transport system substrate-binding protein